MTKFKGYLKADKLWPTAKGILRKVFEDDGEEPDFEFVERVLAEFSFYDPESFAFRYPRDKHGNNPLEGLTHINIRHLVETINKLADILDAATSTGISVYRDWQNDMYSPIY